MATIRKFLDLSTAHITAKTRDLFNNGGCSDDYVRYALVDLHGEYGWWVYAEPVCSDYRLPDDLDRVMRYARDNGCDWILFDCDAAEVDDLPTYKW